MDEMTSDERARDSEMTEPSFNPVFARIVEVPHATDPVKFGRAVCSLCRVTVHPADRFCRNCGVSFVNGGSYGT